MASAKILLDTDVIIEWLRNKSHITQKIKNLIKRGAVLAWTPISVAEIYAGMRKGEEKEISNLFLVLEALSITDTIGKRAGQYLSKFSKSYGVEIADALIAASATHYGMQLWTLNIKHYPMPDISIFKD